MYNKNSLTGNSNYFVDFLGLLLIWRGMFGTVMLINNLFSANVYIAAYVCWIIFATVRHINFINKVIAILWPMALFVSINILFDIVFASGITHETINNINAFIMATIFLYYIEGNLKFKKIALLIIFIDFGVIIVNTTILLQSTPNLVRMLSTQDGLEKVENISIIATYATVYSVVAYIVFLIFTLKNIDKKFLKFAALILIALLSFFVIKCSLFIAVGLIAIGLFIRVFPEHRQKTIILIGLACLVILLLRVPFGNLMLQMSHMELWGDILKDKFNDFGNLSLYGSSGAYMSEMRFELYQRSINTFLNNPFLGIHSIGETSYRIGYHSGWLDGFANYGLLRYPFYIAFIIGLYKIVRDAVSPKYQYGIMIVFLIYVLFGMVNPNVFPQIWTVICLVIPFSISIIDDYNEKNTVDNQLEI
jgi:hypothetical protein